MDLVFPSKRDAWIVAVTWLTVAGFAAGAFGFFSSGALAERITLGSLMVVAGVFIVWTTYGTAYTVTATEIRVRSGPFRWRVPLATITSIAPTKNPLSSPAISLDRLRVAYGGRVIMLSPADKRGFLAAIGARCPSLTFAGDRLVPRA